MTHFVATQRRLYVNQYDFTGDLSGIALDYGAEPQDHTVYGDDTRKRLGGLKTVECAVEGFWRGGTGLIDEVLFGLVGTGAGADYATVLDPLTSTLVGARSYTFPLLSARYQPFGNTVGDAHSFTFDGQGQDEPAAGNCLDEREDATSSATGTAVNVGAIPSGATGLWVVHVLSISGGTGLELDLQSDNAEGFPSAAAVDDWGTGELTAVGSFAKEVAGPVTDSWWRVNYDAGGGTVSFVTALGIRYST